MIVAIYKGEQFICSGTVKECAEILGVKERTIIVYKTPSYLARAKKRKNSRNMTIAVVLDDENE